MRPEQQQRRQRELYVVPGLLPLQRASSVRSAMASIPVRVHKDETAALEYIHDTQMSGD